MDAATAVQSRLIGAIFVAKNLITAEQLTRALEVQEETGERLGEIVVSEFGVSRLELASVLAEQWAEFESAERAPSVSTEVTVREVEALTPGEVQIRRPIGEIFVELGFITSDQLESAVDVQRITGSRIGEILVDQGSLTRLDLASALAEQWSAFQKLRPPAPVADPQPWQNGVPAPAPPPARSHEDGASVTTLEEKVRLLESAQEATPSQEDLRRVTAELQASLAALEGRVEVGAPGSIAPAFAEALAAVNARVQALEGAPVEAEIEALRAELEALRAGPATDEELAGLHAAVARLEARPDRAEAITQLGAELVALSAKLDGLAGTRELADKLDAVAGQAEVAQAGIAGLSRRLDDLAALEGRLDEVAGTIPRDEVIEELRREVALLAEQAGGSDRPDQDAEIASLVARTDELAARVDEVAAVPLPDLTPRIDELETRVEVVAGWIAGYNTDGLSGRIAALEAEGRADTGSIERLAMEIGVLGARLETLGSREHDLSEIDTVRTRVEALAGEIGSRPDAGVIDELRARLDEVAAVAEREPDLSLVDELRSRVEELTAAVSEDAAVGALEQKLVELEQRVASGTPTAELREELRRVAESTATERESLAEALFARVEEITETVPRVDELTELRSRLDELGSRPSESATLQGRIDEIARRLEGLDVIEGAMTVLRTSVEELEAVRVGDAGATGARFATLEQSVSALAAAGDTLRDNLSRELDGRADDLAARLDGAETRLGLVGDLEERIAALSVELDGRTDGEALANLASELRRELGSLASRPTIADPSDRLDELSRCVDRSARESQHRIGEVTEALQEQLGRVESELTRRVEELARRTDGLIGRDEVAERVAEQAAWVRAELEAVREASQAHAAATDASIAEVDARVTGEHVLAARLDDTVGSLRSDLETLQQESAGRAAWESRVESLLERRLDELSGRLTAELGRVRAEAESATATLQSEQSSLAARFVDLLDSRTADIRTARAATERLAEQVAALAGLRQNDADAARVATANLSARLESLGESLRAEAAESRRDAAAVRAELEGMRGEVAGAFVIVDDVGAQVGILHERRADDLAAAELAGAELVARLDDHAGSSAAAAVEVELALREELGGVAARLEERDAQGIEGREALRGELERVASSVGWRLERIEESLATDESSELQTAVAALESRLEAQIAVGEEQVRTTERALRKGLASLGEKLADSETDYVDAGNALRRSIERLGAAVVEADARMAEQIPVSDAEGCVAFAPTAAGYRLVEIPGTPPELGSTIELDDCDGPLVVTRYGRSPLPLDGRPCAYLDRV